ncbi:MAG: vitamin K epoxide reductase family protein [Patescibacteria group bacterium]
MTSVIIEFIIIGFALVGLCLSIYIYWTKQKGESLVCPIDGSCDIVVHSEYSVLLGIPLEVFGMFYYGGVALLRLAAIIASPALYESFILVGAAVSAAGFLMSLYFTWLQVAKLKQWCAFCTASTLITTMIFIFSFFGFWQVIGPFLGL